MDFLHSLFQFVYACFFPFPNTFASQQRIVPKIIQLHIPLFGSCNCLPIKGEFWHYYTLFACVKWLRHKVPFVTVQASGSPETQKLPNLPRQILQNSVYVVFLMQPRNPAGSFGVCNVENAQVHFLNRIRLKPTNSTLTSVCVQWPSRTWVIHMIWTLPEQLISKTEVLKSLKTL